MKSKHATAVFGVIFLAAIMVQAYGLFTLGDSLLVVLCSGAAVLITGFLFIKAIQTSLQERQEKMRTDLIENMERLEHAQLMMEKSQKEAARDASKEIVQAISELRKEIASSAKLVSGQFVRANEQTQDLIEDQAEYLLDGIREIEAHTTKLLIKHELENTGKLAAYNKKYVLYLAQILEQMAVAAPRPVRKKKPSSVQVETEVMAELSPEVAAEAAMDNLSESVPMMEPVGEDLFAGMEAAEVMMEETASTVMPEEVLETATVSEEETAPEPAPALEVSGDPNKQLSPDEIAALFASAGDGEAVAEPEPEPEPAPTLEVSGDPNKQLSPDEIAALFASAGGGASEPEPEPEPAPTLEVSGDPNKQLSPDEIAALFASAGGGEAAAEPEPEPAPTLEVSGDPNKQLSPDEIAALFASAGGGASEPEPEPEPAPTLEVSGDPNKQLSPDEIAALFASAGGGASEPEPEPEPAPTLEVSGDPNKQLSPDEIAALFASAGGGAPAPEPEPAPAAPEIDMSDPNKQLSPDEIAALFASMG